MDRQKDLRLLAFLCVLIAIWAVTDQYLHGSVAMRLASGFLWAFAFIRVGEPLRPPRTVSILLAMGGIAALVTSILWFGMNPGRALAYFLIASTLAKSFSIEDLNDYNEQMLLAALSMLAAGAFTTDPGYVFLLVIFFPLSGYWLYRSHLSAERRAHRQYQGVGGAGKVVISGDERYVRGFVATAIACCIPALILYSLIPRHTPSLPFFKMSEMRRHSATGFGGELRLGEMSKILEDPTPVLRVKMLEDGKASYTPTLYLRGSVSDRYVRSGRAYKWLQRRPGRDSATLQTTTLSDPTPIQPPVGALTSQVYWRFYYERRISDHLFVVDRPTAIATNQPMQVAWSPATNTLRASDSPGKGFCYELLTEQPLNRGGVRGAGRPATSPSDDSKSDALRGRAGHDGRGVEAHRPPSSMPSRRTFLQGVIFNTDMLQPEPVDLSAFRRIAEQIIRDETLGDVSALTDSDRVRRILSHLRTRFEYTLDNRDFPAGTEPVEAFLTERRRGHCEYFASAMALMCQALGLDARVVSGFKGGEYNSFGNYFLVRNCDAHAWVEVYFAESGWMRFDPTPPARDNRLRVEETGLTKLFWDVVDLMRFSWFSQLTDLGGDRRDEFIHRVREQLLGREEQATDAAARVKAWVGRVLEWIRGDAYQQGWLRVLHWVLVVLVVVMAFCLLRIACMVGARAWSDVRSALRRHWAKRFGTAWTCPVEFYRKALLALANHGVTRAETQTAEEFAESIGVLDEELHRPFSLITSYYQAVRFGHRELGSADRHALESALREINVAIELRRPGRNGSSRAAESSASAGR